jgi:hypothetical protein
LPPFVAAALNNGHAHFAIERLERRNDIIGRRRDVRWKQPGAAAEQKAFLSGSNRVAAVRIQYRWVAGRAMEAVRV